MEREVGARATFLADGAADIAITSQKKYARVADMAKAHAYESIAGRIYRFINLFLDERARYCDSLASSISRSTHRSRTLCAEIFLHNSVSCASIATRYLHT